MIPIEVSRLLRLLGSEYPHHALRVETSAKRQPVWNAILADVPYLIGCEAVQEWVDQDWNRGRLPRPGQLRDLAMYLAKDDSKFDRQWQPLRISGFYFRARLCGPVDAVSWAVYGLEKTVRSIDAAGTEAGLVGGFDAIHKAVGSALRFLDSVVIELTPAQIRDMVPLEAIAA